MDDSINPASRPQVTIAVPVHNEASAISGLLRQICDVANELGCSYELLVIEDGSTDSTSEILQAASAEYPTTLRVLRHPRNMGNGAAVKTGIRQARGDYLVLMDGDGQHDPADIPRLLEGLEESELVVGARTANSSSEWHRKLANSVFNRLASFLTRVEILDLTSGFRAFRTPQLREIVHLLPNGFSYPVTSTMAFIKAGYRVRYMPITATRRVGRSKLRPLPDGIKFLFIILRMIVLFEPLKVFVPTALVLIGLAIASFMYTAITESRLHIPNSSVFLSISAVLVFLIALVAEQIAELRVSLHSRDR